MLITDWDYYKRYHPDLTKEQVAEVYCPTHTEADDTTPVDSQPATHATPVDSQPATSQPPGPASDSPKSTNEDASEQVAMRHALRMVELPRGQAAPSGFQFYGPAWILGDNADATALRNRLQGLGIETWRIPNGANDSDTLQQLEQRWKQQRAPHLFVMSGRDPDAAQTFDRETWQVRRHRGVVLPFLVCRKWWELVSDAGLPHPASLVAVTSLGGDFGFSHTVPAPEGGAMTGLVKGLWMENGASASDGTSLKVIDAPTDIPSDRLANEILAELQVTDLGVEVAVSCGARRVPRLERQAIECLPRNDLPRGGNWVFTGGARGITAVAAREMGKRLGLKLHLLGSSPMPQVDPAWLDYDKNQLRQLRLSLVGKAQQAGQPPGKYWDRTRKDLEIAGNLRDLAAAGVDATYHCCDVTDWSQLDETLRDIRRTSGPIEGVVHGAGIHGPALSLAETTPEILSDMLDVKVDSAFALMSLTREDPLRFFVGFGSITGRFGSFNASAYSIGSDMLCKLIGWYRQQCPDCTAVGIHWHPWGEVGMMTRPVAQHTIKVFKMKMMPPREGANHLIQELRAGAPESETLITDAQFYETFFSKELLIPSCPQANSTPMPGALVEGVVQSEQGGKCAVRINLDPVRDPFLSEHLLRDKPTLPLVVALEAFAETASLLGGSRPVAAINDVQITDAIRFFDASSKEVRVLAEITPEGVRCQLTSDFRNRRGQLVQQDRPHFSGCVTFRESPPSFDAVLPTINGKWFEMTYPESNALMYHGPSLRLLQRMSITEAGTFGQIRLPKTNALVGTRDASRWLTPSAAIDACYYACGIHTWFTSEQGVSVPHSLRSIRFGRSPRADELTVVQIVCREMSNSFGEFDFTQFGDDGSVILQASGYRCHVIRGGIA